MNSFGVSTRRGGARTGQRNNAAAGSGPLSVKDIVNAIVPSITHQSQDVRNASTKILLDVQRLSGAVKEDSLISLTNEKTK